MESRVKGFLVSEDTGIAFALSPKITTIGYEGCDLNVEGAGIDGQHAMVEFIEKDHSFLLSDLQSTNGTYVNNVRVNGVMSIAPGDQIRFGNNGTFEFVVEQPSQQLQQRAQIRTSSRQSSPQLHPVVLMQQDAQVSESVVPILGANSSLQRSGANSVNSLISLKNRPNSATALGTNSLIPAEQPARRSSWSTQPPFVPPAMAAVSVSPVPRMASPMALVRSPIPTSPLAGITSPKPPSSASLPVSFASSRQSAPFSMTNVLQDKEARIAELTAEIGRLRAFETDKVEKESLIRNLQGQLNELHNMIAMLSSTPADANSEIAQRLRRLEDEVNARRIEINQFKSQLGNGTLRDSNSLLSSTSSSRTFVVAEEPQSHSPVKRSGSADLDKLRNENQATSNLVTQLQKDMGNKQSQIAALTAQNEALKKELRSKEVELAAVYTKVTRLKDLSKYEEQMAAREKELVALRDKFKVAEARGQESAELLKETREELERKTKDLDDHANTISRLKAELEASQKQLADSRRAEREQSAEIESVRLLHERFRTRLMQVAYTVPQVRVPEAEVSDDQLVEMTRKLASECVEAIEHARADKEKASEAAAQRLHLVEHAQKFKDSLNESVSRLRSSGLLSRNVKQEMQLLQAEPVDDSIVALKDAVLAAFAVHHAWLLDVEAKLEASGINVNISEHSHAQHIASLQARLDATLDERNLLQRNLDESELRMRDDLKAQTSRLRDSHEAALKEAVGREKLLAEENLQKTLREIHVQAKEERNEMQARFEREKNELTGRIEQLKKALADKTADEQARAAQLDKALADLSEARDNEQKLLDEIEQLQRAASEQQAANQEQVKQHVQVAAELNDRLKRVSKLTEDYELQIHELRKDKKKTEDLKRQLATTEQELSEYKQARISPAQFQASEKNVALLKQENAQLKQTLQDQTSIIESLRQDLKGAHARLSDMKGEIPESHKQELDGSRARIYELEQEVRSLRQELKRISSSSDETEQAARSTVSEIEKYREKVFTLQEKLREKDDLLEKLRETHSRQSEDSRNKLGLLEEENKMTAELTALGAQCKGERHHQIIGRQKEALNELRSRIKVLEQLRPGSKHDTAINQVVQLKKELAELKAGKQSSISKPKIPPQAAQVQVVESLNAMLTPDAMDLQFEKQAHEATAQALEISESTYLQLGRSMAGSLAVDHLEGQKSLAYMPFDERERVAAERERACDLLVSRIKVLKDTMARKDDLVQEHEKLLAKLRQIEDIASKRGAQIDKLLEDLRNKTEECELLRDYMHKTKDDLDVAKKLGRLPPGTSTIVATYAPSDAKTRSLVSQRHDHCRSPTSDRDAESARRNSEKIKRKNYEIKSLKMELTNREKDLSVAKNKLSTLEQTLGFASVENSAR